MKNSPIPTGTSKAVLRLILPAILAGSMAIGCGPQAGQVPQAGPSPQAPRSPQSPAFQQAPQSSLVGQWRTVLQGSTLTITILANGQYTQLGVPPNGGTQTAQGGPYALIAPNTIAFSVTDWSPKTRMNFVPCGDPNNPVCNQPQQQPIQQPPNSSYAYRFNGPNTLILSNPNTREVITFTRVTQ